ncbi:MAG: hypothetical protein ABL999_09505 [Pyrinomonadaceae bacterium]
MTPHKQRVIVIEFEKVRTIRKWARTMVAHCNGCGGEADFVGLRSAATLFETPDDDLAAFVGANAVHTEMNMDICIPSLLAVMHERTNAGGMVAVG